ncbi:MAG: peptide-methionine (S)-S-oxide reductase MsrA [Pseudomonadota bacterium]
MMTFKLNPFLVAVGAAGVGAFLVMSATLGPAPTQAQSTADATTPTQTAIFAGGCFWCVEKDFDHVDGVLQTTSGYIGGRTENPTYQSHGPDGHLEAVEIVYNPSLVTYDELSHIFFRTVDPLDDGGQFCDRGNSYRTAIFVLNEEQRAIAETAASEASEELGEQVVTRVLDATTFWQAEEFHQDYHLKNPLRYNLYRSSCRRDRTVERVWGETAYTQVNH